jgi:hypothetical protein
MFGLCRRSVQRDLDGILNLLHASTICSVVLDADIEAGSRAPVPVVLDADKSKGFHAFQSGNLDHARVRDEIDGQIEVEDVVLDGNTLADHIDHRLGMRAYEGVLRVKELGPRCGGLVGEEEEAAHLSGLGFDLALFVDEQNVVGLEGVLKNSKFELCGQRCNASYLEL